MIYKEIEDIPRRVMILEYITQHDGCTKTQVIEYMKGRSALATTHSIIKSLTREGIIVSLPDKNNRQLHHLHINDKNKFNFLLKQSDQVHSTIENFTALVNEDQLMGNDKWRKNYGDLIHLGQLIFYTKIGRLAHTVNNQIKSSDDRDILYRRLAQILDVSNQLNQDLYPALVNHIDKQMKNMASGKLKTNQIQLKLTRDLMSTMMNIIREDTV